MSWTMPYAEIGDIVFWYRNGTPGVTHRFPALVLSNQQNSVMLKVFSGAREGVVECCRHIDDKNARPEDRESDGAWEHRPAGISIGSPVIIKKDK